MRKPLLLLSLLVLGTVMAACGGGSGSNEGASSSAGVAASGGTSEAAQASEGEVWKVGIDPTYRPFGFYKDGKLVGVDVDFARAMAEEMGVKLQLVPFNFSGLIPALNSGQIDAEPDVAVTEERKKQIDFTTPIFEENVTLVVPTESPNPPADLHGVKLGVTVGTAAETAIASRSGLDVTRYDSVVDAYNDLLAGRIDAVAVETTNAGYSTKFTYPGKLRVTNQDLLSEPLPDAAVVKKGNTDLLARMNAAIEKMKADGRRDQILKKWFGDVKF